MELTDHRPRATPAATDDAGLAGRSISEFGLDLFAAVARTARDENVVVSPTSVAMALAMLEPGTSGNARTELRRVLRIDEPEAFHASMNALERSLHDRATEDYGIGEWDPGEVTVRLANAAYVQHDYPFEAFYLDTVATHYGAAMKAVDFITGGGRDAAAGEINRFVAAATHDRITDIVGPGVFTERTRLALVNALYLKASWFDVFAEAMTNNGDFTGLDGRVLTVPMMDGTSGSSAAGDGWVGAEKAYVGDLCAQFILPDHGRFAEVEARIGGVFADYRRHRAPGARLAMPRFDTRFNVALEPAFRSLGLDDLYEKGGLLGIAADLRLVVDKALHETFVAMDETGTEAAACTVLTMRATSKRPGPPPVPVVLDRPFLFRVVDGQTGATLFLGRVIDPS